MLHSALWLRLMFVSLFACLLACFCVGLFACLLLFIVSLLLFACLLLGWLVSLGLETSPPFCSKAVSAFA